MGLIGWSRGRVEDGRWVIEDGRMTGLAVDDS